MLVTRMRASLALCILAASLAAPVSAQKQLVHLKVTNSSGGLVSTYRVAFFIDDSSISNYGANLPFGPGNWRYDCTPPSLGGDPKYPANCQLPSFHFPSSNPTPYALANQNTLNQATGISLPLGRYIISVAAPGFVSGGALVTVPGNVDPILVTLPLIQPPQTATVFVFQDANANGVIDPREPGLQGSQLSLYQDVRPFDNQDNLNDLATDYYGNPIGTTYKKDANGNLILDASGKPLIDQPGNGTISTDANGNATIPYLAPNPYRVRVTHPASQTYYQTTTETGGLSQEFWVTPNSASPVDLKVGFVPKTNLAGFPNTPTNGGSQYTGGIQGLVLEGKQYASPATLIPGNPVLGPVVTLWDPILGLVYVNEGNPDGTFDITHVPDGNYKVTIFDDELEHHLEQTDVTVANGGVTNLGDVLTPSYFGSVSLKFCNDSNRNGKCDPGETPVAGLPVFLLKPDGTVAAQGTTGYDGMHKWPDVQLAPYDGQYSFDPRRYVTGYGYQTDNQSSPTTVIERSPFSETPLLDQGFDTHLEYATHLYETDPALGPTNGGINALVIHAPPESTNGPGIPGVQIQILAPVPCTPSPNLPRCVQFGPYFLVKDSDGSWETGSRLYLATTAPFTPPAGCIARDGFGNPLNNPALPDGSCLRFLGYANQVGNNPVPRQGAIHVDASPGVYIVQPSIPLDPYTGKPLFKVANKNQIFQVQNGTGTEITFPMETANNVPPPYHLNLRVKEDLANLPIPNATIAVYNHSDELIETVHTDTNGAAEVELPREHAINPFTEGSIDVPSTIKVNDPGNPGYLPNCESTRVDVGPTLDIFHIRLLCGAAPEPPAITSPSSLTVAPGTTFSFTVTVTANPTAKITATGVPSGSTFVDNGDNTAKFSGTLTGVGTNTITITASNGVTPNATQTFTITVTGTAPAITSASSATGTVGSSFSSTVTGTGNPLPTFSATGLPAGWTVTNNGNGTATISGTLTAVGTITLTITASNGVLPNATQTLTITVTGTAPAITSASSATGTVGSSFSSTVAGTGNPLPTFSATGLPAGWTVTNNGNGTATISGPLTAVGTITLTITASNGVNPSVTQTLTITVTGTAPSFTSTTPTTVNIPPGTTGSFTVAVTANPTAKITITGLPAGFTAVDNGNNTAAITGGSTLVGTALLTATATNSVGTAQLQITLIY